MKKAFLEKSVVELVHKFDEKSYCECEKVRRSLKFDSKYFFGPQTYKHIYMYICGHQNRSLYLARDARVG